MKLLQIMVLTLSLTSTLIPGGPLRLKELNNSPTSNQHRQTEKRTLPDRPTNEEQILKEQILKDDLTLFKPDTPTNEEQILKDDLTLFKIVFIAFCAATGAQYYQNRYANPSKR